MKVRELIECLEGEDPEKEVLFCYNYGDHWRTTVAQSPDSVEEGLVVHSAYHNMYKVIDNEEGEVSENARGKDVQEVVLLSSF